MTTEKQISANRRNGVLSRGPKTAAGKAKSSRNAFRHGLSLSASRNPAVAQHIRELAQALTDDPERFSQAMLAAEGEVDLARVRTARAELLDHKFSLSSLSASDGGSSDTWSRAEKLERYERRARTRMRRGRGALD